MKKNIIGLLLASAFILSALSGCSSNEGSTTETTTAEPVPTASEESTEAATEAAETETVTTEGEQGGSTSEDGTVNKIADAIKAAYGDSDTPNDPNDNYLPDMPTEGELIQQFFGIEPDLYTEIFAETPMISTIPDTLIIAKAAEGKLEDLKSKLEAHRERLINDTMQYPINLPKINASQVVVNGDYVAFIMLGAFNEDDTAPEEEQLKFAQEQEQIGIDAFNKYFE